MRGEDRRRSPTMRRRLALAFAISAIGMIVFSSQRTTKAEAPTFSDQVVRIFQRNCQTCHHPGDIAPFSLMSYSEARPWASTIKDKTQSREMPPWKPASGCGEFDGDRSLTSEEIATLAAWAD